MVVYNADQNQVVFFYESGTYGSASGGAFWPGLVQSNEIDENVGVIELRNTGTASRNVNQFVDGPTEYRGTLTTYPQDWRLLLFALGDHTDAGSPSPYTHTLSEANSNNVDPFNGLVMPTFQVEDAQRSTVAGSHFLRTVKGCMVDSVTFTATEGEPVQLEVEFVGQSVTYASGAATSVTAVTTRPFMWRDSIVHIPSGTTLGTAKEVSVVLNNNLEVPHYVTGSRDIGIPIPGNRDYEVSITLNADTVLNKALYDQYFLGGSTFNMIVASNLSTGSRTIAWTFSGCKMVDMEAATGNEGVNEQTLTIHPQTSSVFIDDDSNQYIHLGSSA